MRYLLFASSFCMFFFNAHAQLNHLNKKTIEYYDSVGSQLGRSQHFREALPYYDTAVNISNDSWQYYYRGATYYYLKKYDKALVDIFIHLKEYPNDYRALYFTGMCFRKKTIPDLDSALAYFDRSIYANAHFADSYFQRGLAYMDKTNDSLASIDFTKAIELNPDPFYYANRGVAYHNQNKFELAIPDYEQYLLRYTYDADVLYRLGVCYFHINNYVKAIAKLTRSIQLVPSNPDALYNRGLALEKLKKFTDAINDFSDVLKLDPSMKDAATHRDICDRAIAFGDN